MSSEQKIREARREDMPAVYDLAYRAFIHDPVFNYFGDLKTMMELETEGTVAPKGKAARHAFLRIIAGMCFCHGGRIVVAEIDGKLVSVVAWYPPRKRVPVWNVVSLVRNGGLSTFKEWGLRGLRRVAVEFMDPAEDSLHRAFKAHGRPASDNDRSWYLALAGTDPEFQGRGIVSRLIQEGIDRAPGEDFTLTANTPHAASVYRRLGFETFEVERLGVGRVDERGLPASGENAEGVPYEVMIYVSAGI
ncbi:acyl-CoA N-acyltransferase [Fistulina hepatica ATCC 64428]|uniref:Acyl-CoA N-acyltransferase n=1 Tax=Fistulina hepatica ATCC 64428 TaxID=1128425 RepID=A0A0D7APV7_9AGAR|nr:acyl-CoA N-acyltransferase [Fistulina hepatica ATCC 64428]